VSSSTETPPPPVLAVLQRGDSFAHVWPQLTASLGVRLRTGSNADGLAPLGEACCLLLVLSGEEERAAAELPSLQAAGAGAIAVVGSSESHRLAISAIRAGAREYFALPADVEALRVWVGERVGAELSRRRAAELAAAERTRFDFSGMVGASAALRAALDAAARLIPHRGATVLITGETGTGKEVLARAIHYNGPNAVGPFVEVNCTALPAQLLEAELFGYEKGAFTDARAAKPGLFEAAHGGTLFLDEIGDLPLDLQAKLLRALEQKQVRRLGSLRTLAVDARIVVATHVDLAAAAREGRFREDLFFRLSVVPIHLPPLRDRGRDVLLLAERFAHSFAAEYAVGVPTLTDDVRRALLAHDWPGNVRELRNAIERAILLGDGGISVDHLFAASAGSGRAGTGIPFPATLAEIERAAVRRMIERLDGNKSAAAEVLGISRSRLYRLLDEV
jgi:DNA-binding NtrC family response regulator